MVFADLGSAPPSNAYLTADALRAQEAWFPLRVVVCTACWLVQTDDHTDRAELFSDDYAYFSSISTSWLTHAETYAMTMTAALGLDADSFVVEIAANDGYLLQYFARAGIPCLGVEPTHSTAEAARVKGIAIIEEFFGVDLARRIVASHGTADLIAANNVLAHVPDINDFAGGFRELLAPDGTATFEFPHLLKLIAHHQFDTIYHEHYSYLSLGAVARIFEASGLRVVDVETLTTHGGSLRVHAQRSATGTRNATRRVAEMLAVEAQAGLTSITGYMGFQEIAERVKDGLLAFLLEAKRTGKRVAAYGAAAKGNTLLNFAGIRPDLLPYVVDRAAAKQNRFMPGSRIPIVAEDRLRADRPDYVLLLPWNLEAELTAQLSYAHEWGARFVVAVPELRISEVTL